MDEKLSEKTVSAEEPALPEDRRRRVAEFLKELDLDTETPAPETEEPAEIPEQEEPEPEEIRPTKKKKKKRSGCLGGILYLLIVLIVAVCLAVGVLIVAVDYTGITKSDEVVDLTIEEGWYGEDIANALKDSGIINYPLVFRLYCKLSGADGTLQPGDFTLSPSMGYEDVVAALQVKKARESVRVTIPEGFTVDKIAALLEEKQVCEKTAFYEEMYRWKNYADYDFVQELIDAETADPAVHKGRIYMLEGYLFPDTYDFFTNCAASTVVKKMLDNFDAKLDTPRRAALKAQGWTIDEAVILSSIIQREASASIMDKVSRVLLNRLNNTATYPKLECCSTRDYINAILKVPELDGLEITTSAYNTYLRPGLPVGAICNPGLAAVDALISPSEDPDMQRCYFFATDWSRKDQNGEYITKFSKTYAEHEAYCRRYKIGAYG